MNKKTIWVVLIIICIVSLGAEVFVHREGHFGFDGFYGYYAVLGFASSIVMLLIAWVLGSVLGRREDYYD